MTTQLHSSGETALFWQSCYHSNVSDFSRTWPFAEKGEHVRYVILFFGYVYESNSCYTALLLQPGSGAALSLCHFATVSSNASETQGNSKRIKYAI